MRCLVISDIHSNLAAFQAVLDDADGKYDKVWCLGDVVGYGPDPNECIEQLAGLDHLAIAGNHDWAVLGKLDVDDFNPDARHVSIWTRNALTENNNQFLQKLPIALIQEERFTLVHGSPRHRVLPGLELLHPFCMTLPTDLWCRDFHLHSVMRCLVPVTVAR